MFDPIELGRHVEKVVCKGEERLYYRFRGGRFYGGVATADVVGCNLRCVFCWSWRASHGMPPKARFFNPFEVGRQLVEIAKRNAYAFARLSGGEPTLCFEHLLRVIKTVTDEGLIFILETNGILIGYDRSLAKRLASFDKVFVRVSIKAPTPETFSKITGAQPDAFEYQIRALENLVAEGLEPPWVRAALVLGYGSKEEYSRLLERLASIHPKLVDIEPEIIVLYPSVKRRLEEAGLLPKIYHLP